MYVDMDELVEASRRGIPEEVRGTVWKYLLHVSSPDKSEVHSHVKKLGEEYASFEKSNPEVSRVIKAEMARYNRDSRAGRFFSQPNVRNKIEHILVAYFSSHPDLEFAGGFVHLVAPFVSTISKEYEIYFCFASLMKYLEGSVLDPDSLNERLANFMMLFRSTQPELVNYFEEEELYPNEWAPSWLQFLLARELPLACILRLLDTYFTNENFLDLHMYVCLAILEISKETLMELEYSEIKGYLSSLPELDMHRVIIQAINLREEIKSRDLL